MITAPPGWTIRKLADVCFAISKIDPTELVGQQFGMSIFLASLVNAFKGRRPSIRPKRPVDVAK